MIDLHIHTTNSDGEFGVTEILEKAESKKLKVISIKPGVIKTKIWEKSIDENKKVMERLPETAIEKYRREFEYLVKNAEKNI